MENYISPQSGQFYMINVLENQWLFIGRRPQFRLLAKYIHKTVRTDTDRARCDWLLLMIKYWWAIK